MTQIKPTTKKGESIEMMVDEDDTLAHENPPLHLATLKNFMDYYCSLDLQIKNLLSESYTVFASLQALSKDLESEIIPVSHCLHFSRHFRAVLHAHSLSLNRKLAFKEDDTTLRNSMAMAGVLEMVWHLFEILYMDAGSPIAPKIIQWYQWHFLDDELKRSIESEETMTDTEYWNMVYRLAMQGRTKDAAALLSRHPERGDGSETVASDPFQTAITLLENIPFESPSQFSEWQSQCEALGGLDTLSGIRTRAQSQSQPESTLHHIRQLGSILAGSSNSLHFFSSSWLELFIAELMYKVRNIKPQDLRYQASDCVGRMEESKLTDTDYILLALLDYDAAKALRLASSISVWFGAHMSDLLFHVGDVDLGYSPTDTKIPLRDYFLNMYSKSILEYNPSLFEVALHYLMHCPSRGREWAEDILLQSKPKHDVQAHMLLHTCSFWTPELTEAAQSICRQMGNHYISEGQVPAAVSWFLQAGDHNRIAGISEELVADAMCKGAYDSLAAVGDALCDDDYSGGVRFLRGYLNFHKCLLESNLAEAAGWLFALISSTNTGMTPKRFVPAILVEAMPIIEGKDAVLDPRNTYLLMESLEELETSHHTEDLVGVSPDTIGALRLALARNLARALVL